MFALLSIGDLLGVIMAVLFGLLSAALILTGLASWRGYVIAWLIVHVLAAAYRVAVQRGWLRPQYEPTTAEQLAWRTPWGWARNSLLQTIFGSVSFVALVAVLYLRPTVPWKYRVDIPLMILVVIAVVALEYALLAGSGFRHPVTTEQPGQDEPEHNPTEPEAAASLASTNGDPMVGKVVPNPDVEQENLRLIHRLDFRLGNVEDFLWHQQANQAHDGDAHAPARDALEGEPSDPPMWFYASDPVRSWAESDELPVGATRLELLSIARLTTRLESSNGMADHVVGINGIAGRVVGITLERRTVPISPEPDETVSQVITKATEALSREIETCAAAPGQAQAISPPNWEVVSARWVQAGSAGVSTAAKTVTDLGASLDNILHAEPVRRTFSWNAPGSAAAVIGKDAETKDILHIGGIVVGSMSDQLVAISACFRSLARDDFTRSLAAGIARELSTIGLSRAPTPSSMHRQAG